MDGDILTIPAQRLPAAKTVYVFTIAILFITIITAPFKALFIARENIVYISIVEICDGIIKLLFALSLAYISYDKLITYSIMMTAIQCMNLLAFSLYGKWKFDECNLLVSKKLLNKQAMKQLTGFAGWTTYGMGALAARNQGTAIILNHFFGTVINAAYGIANQVNFAIFFISSSIVNAMNPQIMKAEGEGNRQLAFNLAIQESKYSTTLLSIAAIPLLIEMPTLLNLWLEEVPDNTALFCTFILSSCLVDQLTIGLNAVNQAMGNIRTYSLLMFTPKLIILPIAVCLLHYNYSVVSVFWLTLLIELAVAIMRLPYLKHSAGLKIWDYIKDAILPVIPMILMMLIVGFCISTFIRIPGRFLLTISLSVCTGLITAWFFTFKKAEREYVTNLFKQKLHR